MTPVESALLLVAIACFADAGAKLVGLFGELVWQARVSVRRWRQRRLLRKLGGYAK